MNFVYVYKNLLRRKVAPNKRNKEVEWFLVVFGSGGWGGLNFRYFVSSEATM